jgi:hypothetical protein
MKLKISLALLAFVTALLAVPSGASAYTLYYKWSSNNATFTMDSNYTGAGSKWADKGRAAANNWGSAGVNFSFSESWFSGNHLQAMGISCTCTAQTIQYNNGANMIKYTIQVNTNVPHYDGTQSPSLPSNYYDLQSEMRHEFGHGLGLCHTKASGGIYLMEYAPVGQYRYIDTDAKNGAQKHYLPGYSGPGPSGACIP